MADHPDAADRNGKARRRGRGFARAGALIEAQTRTLAAKRGFALARLQAFWVEIAGPEVAAVASPVKLTLARGPAGGILTLGVRPACGPQAQMLAPLVRERVNAALGPGTVGRVTLAQGGFAEPPAAFAGAPRGAAAAAPDPPGLDAVTGALSSIGDAELRRNLETLARNVLSRSAKRRTEDP